MTTTEFDNEYLIYSLANTFRNNLGIELCDDTAEYLSGKISKKYGKLPQEDKLYYATYSLKLAQSLLDYIPRTYMFALNLKSSSSESDTGSDSNSDDDTTPYNFKLKSKKCGTKRIRLVNTGDFVNDIIPCKLMKICKYRKNTNVSKEFRSEYEHITEKMYEKISSKEKYSDLNEKRKNKIVYEPVTSLVSDTLSKKRKCAEHLYEHMFGESDTIVMKIYKKRFVIYDFGVVLQDSSVKSFSLSKHGADELKITFNNGTKFILTLKTNSTEIKEHISLKFHVKFDNLDELFVVRTGSV